MCFFNFRIWILFVVEGAGDVGFPTTDVMKKEFEKYESINWRRDRS